MANITGASLNPIYSRLNGVSNYHPYNAEAFMDWTTEAGDTIKVSRDGENFTSPIHSSSLVWKGSPVMTLNSTGKQQREPIARVSKKKYAQSGAGSRNNRSSTSRWHHIEEDDTYWRSYFSDEVGNLYSVVEQTAAYWRSTLVDVENQWETVVEQTASSWRATLSGVMYNGRVTAASIALAFNNQGEAGASISGDWISLDGDTKLTGALRIVDGALHVQKTAYFGNNVYITGGNKLILQTSGTPAANYELTPAIMASMVVKAAVSGNTLKLWTYGEDQTQDPSLTFSKATSLSGEWASGVFTVTASPQSKTILTSLTQGAASWSGKTATVPIYATINSGATPVATGKSVTATYSGVVISDINECYTTAPNGASYDGNTNTSGGYFISGNGRGASCGIVVKCELKQGNTVQKTLYNDLITAPNNLYKKGWDNAADKIDMPSTISGSTTKSSVSVTIPTTSGTTTWTLKLSKDSGGAYLTINGNLKLRVS